VPLSAAELAKERGNAAVKVGRWEEAEQCYSEALAANPSLFAAANNRALALLRLGRPSEAVVDCNMVCADVSVCARLLPDSNKCAVLRMQR
jgi:tetratricopeptide (TPR) repeat protein